MFWNIFCELCNNVGKSPSKVCEDLGLSNAIAPKWKNGSVPRDATLLKIASYFGVTVGYLLGDEEKEKPTDEGELSEARQKLIDWAKNVPDEKVDLLLRVTRSIVEDEP